MNHRNASLLSWKFAIAFLLLTVTPTCPVGAVVVFNDDFSESDGTFLGGKAPDVGGAVWDEPTFSGWTLSGGAVDTTGAAREAFGHFTRPLMAGETLVLDFSTIEAGGAFFSGGFAGFALFDLGGDGLGGATDAEVAFIGDLFGATSSWGTSLGTISGAPSSETVTGTFTYDYDTGDWTIDFSGGGSGSGTTTAGFDIDAIRISNGSGGDIAVDEVTAIAVVPEPSAFLFGGIVCGVMGLNWVRTHRKSKSRG